ncbi:30S ribosomal protein S6 [Telmatospirillum sp.]|uniref:30S ribosomal protein S6 n=1 Tax=Telmatospirillum sp. TaxID=2079197 RepID=UPI00284D3EE3|nr:30S ribosomal protein S6 [Telmatospirillum sp.]MDR3437196.1 30S ribosomal protein S6 [Telmatospirillum sp.]
MSLYECVFIARQDLATPQVETLADELNNILTAQGGTVTKREYWGLRNIAYRIKKNRKGHYVLFNVDAPAPAVKEFERQMSINEDVLRYLSVRVEELEEVPSAVMQSKNQRDDRPRRDGDDRPPRREGGYGRDNGYSRSPRPTEGGEA